MAAISFIGQFEACHKIMYRLIPTHIAAIGLMAISTYVQAEEKTHLFVLSGQSNMFHLKPAKSFTPAVEKAFGKDKVIVVSNSKRGAPIRSWDKDYPWPEGRAIPQGRKKPGKKEKTREEFLAGFGERYDALMGAFKKHAEGKSYDTVTFVWMQGESDSSPEGVKEYENSFNRVLERLKADLGVKDMNVIIGRLSDYGGHQGAWNDMRELQMKMADAKPNWAWVNTDDLNDREKNGEMRNDLHYTDEGYVILGQRFADKAIELLGK